MASAKKAGVVKKEVGQVIKPHEAQKLTESEVSMVDRCESLVDTALRREFTGDPVRVSLGPMSPRERTALGARCEAAGWRYVFLDEPDGPCGQFTQLVLELRPAGSHRNLPGAAGGAGGSGTHGSGAVVAS